MRPHRCAPSLRGRAALSVLALASAACSTQATYEEYPILLLLDWPTDVLVEALQGTPPSENQMEGAARFFSATDFRKRPGGAAELPIELRRALLDHVSRGGDATKLAWARRVLGESG